MKFLMAAGGTGGHITPGIAIATKLKNEGHEVIFIGTENGLETDLVPKAGFELKLIHAEGLKGGIVNNLKAILTLKKGLSECKKIIDEEKPDMVIGTGGYVTAPLMIAGINKKIPTMIHESNALPGKTTKWLSKKVTCVAVGFEDAKKRLGNLKNIVFTGNPSKIGLNQLDKDAVKNKLGINKKLVLVFGGSQGAKKINDTMIDLINNTEIKDYQIIYATGPKNYEEILSKIKVKSENVKIEKYIYNMDEVMLASDLAICRSGALTVTELGIVGLPAVLIPFPHAAENHQYYNAKTIEESKAGIIIQEHNLSCDVLEKTIKDLLNDKLKLEEMKRFAKKEEMTNALEKITKEIMQILGR